MQIYETVSTQVLRERENPFTSTESYRPALVYPHTKNVQIDERISTQFLHVNENLLIIMLSVCSDLYTTHKTCKLMKQFLHSFYMNVKTYSLVRNGIEKPTSYYVIDLLWSVPTQKMCKLTEQLLHSFYM